MMSEKERLCRVINLEMPDKVPHFELAFQIPEEAFGLSWPTESEVLAGTAREREHAFERWFEINERIIDQFHWAAIASPIDFFGDGTRMLTEAKKRLGDRALIYDWNGNGVFWLMDGDDMMDFSVRMYEDPSGVHAEARAKCNAARQLATQQVDQGADFLCINSDFAFNAGPFISPKHFSEFVTPYLAEIVDHIHSLGVKTMLHSDGNLNTILDQLVSAGIDGLQSIDPQGHMDIRGVKAQYGDKLFLMGNVHTAKLQSVNETEIRGFVQYCMQAAKPGGGYIFSTSNCIFDGMPLESYLVMLDEYEKHAWYC